MNNPKNVTLVYTHAESNGGAHYLHAVVDEIVPAQELPLGLPNTENEALFEALRKLRKRLADEEALPAYIVLSDKVLHLLSTSRPTSLEEFGNISGIGEHKKKKYGKEFINLIRKYSD